MKQDKFKESIKESLDSYSPDVPAHLWNNIKAGIPAAPAASEPSVASSQSGTGVASIVKWVAAAVVITGVSIWAWQSVSDEKPHQETAQVEVQPENAVTKSKVLPTQDGETLSESANEIEPNSAHEATPVADAEESISESQNNSATTVGEASETEPKEAADVTEPIELIVNSENVEAEAQGSKSTNKSSSTNESIQVADSNQQAGVDGEAEEYSETETDQTSETYPMVECGILADKVSGEAPLTVSFRNISDARSYEWRIENGPKSFDKEATVTFDEPGDYVVELLVTDFEGNRITDVMEITVLEATTCFVPNAFSPNGDGLNDFFMVQGNNISDMSIEVFRLDGSLVFEGKGIGARWDGSDDQSGVHDQYMAVVRFVRNDGTPDVVKTVLKVIRE